jgi:glycosyltransferase involved in cell wall biosynthesis
MLRRSWTLERVDLARADWLPSEIGRPAWLHSVLVRGRRRLAESAFRELKQVSLAEYSVCACLSELRSLVLSQPADWFIAHTQSALPAAAAAATKWNAKLGFDCEDLLSETGDRFSEANRLIEHRYLRHCDYVTATSHAMARQLSSMYHIPLPTVLYNVFPIAQADGMLPPAQRPAHTRLRLYWVGQTIGLDRGLQDAFEACAGLAGQVEIHLRGQISTAHKRALLVAGERFGVAAGLYFHPRIHPDELIRSMADYDVGLALETPENRNYNLTVTNKLFSYMLAGLAIAATDTPGQREIMSQAPGAGILYPASDARALRTHLNLWLNDGLWMTRAKQIAWEAARTRFCWDIEQKTFLQILERP